MARPPLPRAAPDHLAGTYAEIRKLQEGGRLAEAAAMYPAFLQALGQAWGPESPDMAPYAYNFAVALRLAGRRVDSLAVAAEALKKWPGTLQLQVLEATVRSDLALAERRFDSQAHLMLQKLLDPENFPRLRGLGLEPVALLGQWAYMCFEAGRTEDATAILDRALALDSKDRRSRELKARLLLQRKQPAEARSLLEALLAERPGPDLEVILGAAELEGGDPEAAWGRFSRILSGAEAAAGASPAARAAAALKGARALNQLRRHREAAEVLLPTLLADCEDAEALTELAAAARGLGAPAGAKGVEGRIRFLQQRERLLQTAAKARASGYPSSIAFYEAEAALEVDRTGEALSLLKKAVNRSPGIVNLHLELARVRLLLGRADLAEEDLRSAFKGTGSPLLLRELSRVAAMGGSVEKARAILAEARAASIQPAAVEELKAPGVESLSRGLEARALIELEDYPQAAAVLEAKAPEGNPDDVLSLCKAELAILSGRPSEASGILSGSFDNIPGGQAPGGAVWASTLRRLLPAADETAEDSRSAGRTTDPSDLLDHPRLFLRPAYLRLIGGELPGAQPGWLDRLRSAESRRRQLLASMKGFGDADMLPRWRELLGLYVELGASRKAREVAWYLIGLQPGTVEDHRALAVLLSRPEEVVPRMKVLDAALRLAPGDARLGGLLVEARAFLGLGAVKG